MCEKTKDKKRIHRIIVGALRETINTHGPIHKLLIGSAAKRISGKLFADKRLEKQE